MDKETSNIFFQNVKWFNEFFDGLKELYDKISIILEKEFELSEKSYYYYKPNDKPSIPSTYHLFLGGEEFKLNLAVLFNEDDIKNKKFLVEPSIIVSVHDEYFCIEVSSYVADLQDVKQIKEENNFISGILDWDTEVRFESFQVPLDLFLEYDDKIVKEEIVSKISEILEYRKIR